MRSILVLAAACGSPGSAIAPDAAPSADPDASIGSGGGDPAIWHQRATAALDTLLIDFWGRTYFDTQAPRSGNFTGYWTFAEAFDAVLDGLDRTEATRFGGWIDGLYIAQDARGWSSNYYDDENWMALALVHAYDRTHDPKYLSRAQSLYADIRSAWDTTCCGVNPGGIWWDRGHTQKATASNAGPVIAAVRLAARTGDSSYLSFARQVYAYWRGHMVDPATYQVTDHIAPGGQVTLYRFTYNEGLMIGAAIELYTATHDPNYLDDAHHIANFLISSETRDGVLFDGDNAHCTGDCAQFKGIAYRYLMELQAVDPHDDVGAVLARSVESIWDHARGTGDQFAADWLGPAQTPVSVSAQSSAAMALNIYAASFGHGDATSPDLEAEDGVVHDIGLERQYGVYAGWGYLAGWRGDGQWVDFHVNVPTGGSYTLTMRYAASGNDASRLIYVNGANAVPNHVFPKTGATWDVYSGTSAHIQLNAGANTISIIYNSSLGSTNYLNLDNIKVVAD